MTPIAVRTSPTARIDTTHKSCRARRRAQRRKRESAADAAAGESGWVRIDTTLVSPRATCGVRRLAAAVRAKTSLATVENARGGFVPKPATAGAILSEDRPSLLQLSNGRAEEKDLDRQIAPDDRRPGCRWYERLPNRRLRQSLCGQRRAHGGYDGFEDGRVL